MHVPEESDSGVLPMNHSNKIEQSMAESEEGRPLIKENIHQSSTRPTQSGARVSQGLAGVRKVAREHKEMKFTALLHHVTVDLLRDSFSSLKRKAAPGSACRSAQSVASRCVSGASIEKGLHRERRRTETSARDRRTGRQNRPTRSGHHPQPDL